MTRKCAALVALIGLGACKSGPPTAVEGSFVTDRLLSFPPSASHRYQYYLYIPGSVVGKSNVRILVLANSGPPKDYPQVIADAQQFEGPELISMAKNVGYVGLILVNPHPAITPGHVGGAIYTQNLAPNSLFKGQQPDSLDFYMRPDLVTNQILDEAIVYLSTHGVSVNPRIFITGFSSGGSFAMHYAILHPSRVSAAAIGQGGNVFTYPTSSWTDGTILNYPIGVADVPTLNGTGYSLDSFKSVAVLYFDGANDDNECILADCLVTGQRETIQRLWGTVGTARGTQYINYLKSLGMRAEAKLYSGVGHEFTGAMHSDVMNFFNSVN